MDTIKLTAKGHDVSFSKKSVTIDDKEYLYTGISAIKHSSAKQVYLFRYDGDWHTLYYNDEDERKVSALFSKIAALNAKKAAQAAETSETAQPEAEEIAQPEAKEITQPEPAEADSSDQAGPASESAFEEASLQHLAETLWPETPSENIGEEEQTEAVEVSPEQIEEQTEEPTEETAEEPVEETNEEPAEVKTEDEKAQDETETYTLTDDDVANEISRKSRLKKSIITLVIILAFFAAAAVVLFLTMDSTSDPSHSPNTDGTYQYNDIDELIEEIQ